jgi:hypothetical protein
MRHPIGLLLSAVCLLVSGCSTPGSPPLSNYLLGEKVQLGHLSYTVFETQWLTQLGEGPAARVPQNRFFLVRLTAVNSGTADSAVPNPTIQDDKGHVFEEVSNGEGVPQWAGYLRNVKPADNVQGNIVFDAPPAHYKLKLADETGTKFALIDIPLSFGAETPEVITPTDKKQ